MFIKKDCKFYNPEKVFCNKARIFFSVNQETGNIFPNCRKCKSYERKEDNSLYGKDQTK